MNATGGASDSVMPTSAAGDSELPIAHRAVEIMAILVFGLLVAYLSVRLATTTPAARLWIAGAAALTGYVAADFVSGVVHWTFDSWGSVDTPVLGSNFIRPFREHHRDTMSITRHGFIETNGNNCVAAAPILVVACFIPLDAALGLFATTFLLATSLGLFATNQFHKWAHMEDPGRIISHLQRWHLILPHAHHSVHHDAPYETHYCITTGWLNPVLGATRFFGRVERVVTGITGVEPRQGMKGEEQDGS